MKVIIKQLLFYRKPLIFNQRAFKHDIQLKGRRFIFQPSPYGGVQTEVLGSNR